MEKWRVFNVLVIKGIFSKKIMWLRGRIKRLIKYTRIKRDSGVRDVRQMGASICLF